MHSKTQYLGAALLWDTLLSEKYGGIKVTDVIQLLLEKSKTVGLPDRYYDLISGQSDGDDLFQGQIRRMMDEQARDKSLFLEPEDEFQLLGNNAAGSGPWVGSSQLAQKLDGEDYIFSLQMTETHLSLHVIASSRKIAHADRMVFKLELSPPTEKNALFYRCSFSAHERFIPCQDRIVRLLANLVPEAKSPEFAYALLEWHRHLRDRFNPR